MVILRSSTCSLERRVKVASGRPFTLPCHGASAQLPLTHLVSLGCIDNQNDRRFCEAGGELSKELRPAGNSAVQHTTQLWDHKQELGLLSKSCVWVYLCCVMHGVLIADISRSTMVGIGAE